MINYKDCYGRSTFLEVLEPLSSSHGRFSFVIHREKQVIYESLTIEDAKEFILLLSLAIDRAEKLLEERENAKNI